MKKVLFILAFLAIGMIATAQTQTIYNQLKLATVNDGTVSDSLVLVQGTDKIIRKIPLSSISGSTEIPSLQEVTNNGNVTSHPIHAKEFRVDSNPDSFMVLNNRYFTLGDVGSDYNGNWSKYFSVFDPNACPQGFEFYSRDTVTKGVLSVLGGVNSGNSNFNVYSGGDGGSASFNVNSYYNNSWFTTRSLELGSSGASSSYLRLDPANNELNIQSNNIRFRNSLSSPYVELETSSVTSNRVLNAPDESGTLATQEWVSAQSSGSGTPTLQEVLTEGNTTDAAVIFNTTERYVPRLTVTGVASGYGSVTMNSTGFRVNNNSKQIIQIGGDETQCSIYLRDPLSNYDTFMDGRNKRIGVTDGAGGSATSTEIDIDGIRFQRVGSVGKLKLESMPVSGTPEWIIPAKFGKLAIVNTTAPASATAAGVVGEIRVTSTYIYVCTATNTWVRAPLATW